MELAHNYSEHHSLSLEWMKVSEGQLTEALRTEYAAKANSDYCRSEEITGYVRKVIPRYVAYKSETERLQATSE